jgi:hypothetical protein
MADPMEDDIDPAQPALPDPLPVLLAAAASQHASPVTPYPSTEVDTDDGSGGWKKGQSW